MDLTTLFAACEEAWTPKKVSSAQRSRGAASISIWLLDLPLRLGQGQSKKALKMCKKLAEKSMGTQDYTHNHEEQRY
jgi:hypothetical protein